MRDLHVIVNNKIATYLRRDGSIVCGPNKYQIVFAFDSEWDAYEKKVARFKWNGKSQEVEFTGNSVEVPTLANTTLLEVGVYVEDISTTTSAQIPCLLSCLCGDEVDSGIVLKAGSANANGVYKASEEGADGFSEFTVDVLSIPDGYIKPSGTKEITEPGKYNVTNYEEVDVNIEAGDDSLLPQEISTEAEATALQEGTIFEYVGETTDNFEKGAYYLVEAGE